ncbi:50S ribosomal protein L31 [Candidatus Margulisiibacteriota bacterium]
MKKDIHPKYFTNAKATCVCGAEFTIASNQEEVRVDICSNCHPFYTGEQKILDTEGRVEKFKKRFQGKTSVSLKKKTKKTENA